MNNCSEQEYRWAQEVLYLHSLWRQGPPNQNQTQIPNQNPNSTFRHLPPHDPAFYPRHSSSNPNPYFHPNSNPYYHPNTNPCSHPNPNPNPSRYYESCPRTQLTPQRSNAEQKRESSPGNEWPCDPASVPGQSSPNTWAQFKQPSSNPTTVSPNSSTRASLISMQRAAIQTCKYFFTQDSDSDSECESESESGHDADEFFRSLFENDAQLRGCYEKYHENGEFYCLVCETREGGKKRKGKLYRGCTALAQHACADHKLGRRAGHKALARAICQVLGWDPQRLPTIVLLPGSVVIAGHSENPIPNSDIPDTRKRDPSDGSPGETLEQEPMNYPSTGACPPPENVPHAGDSGTEKISKQKDLDQDEISENYAKEDPKVIVRQNPISNSDYPERKRDTNDGLPGPTLEQEPTNSPGISAFPSPEDVPDAGDSGTEKISKGKDSDQEVISESYAMEYPEGIVQQVLLDNLIH